jgi:hypothetical protein
MSPDCQMSQIEHSEDGVRTTIRMDRNVGIGTLRYVSSRILARWRRCQQELPLVVTLDAYCPNGNAFEVLQVLGLAMPSTGHHHQD